MTENKIQEPLQEASTSHPSFYGRLATVQAEIGTITKDGKNPHFGNQYVTLDAITKRLIPLCRAHDLVVFQTVENQCLVTTVADALSDQQLVNRYPLTWDATNPQKQGSAITYARRYSLGCIFQIATETDDDGNTAVNKHKTLADSASQPATSGQLGAIRSELHRTHYDQSKLLGWAQVDTLEKLTVSQADRCLTSLQKRPSWFAATDQQVAMIRDEVERTGAEEAAILAHYKVDSLTKLSHQQADIVLSKLAGRSNSNQTDELAEFYQGTGADAPAAN